MDMVNSFDYVSTLISIILGLGITQLLTALSDLVYHRGKVRFYWPHSILVYFAMFLFIQDWFITYQLRDKISWHFAELIFVLFYPILLYALAKMLLPTNDTEERFSMEKFYYNQFPTLYFLLGAIALFSMLFNHFLLELKLYDQLPVVVVMLVSFAFAFFQPTSKRLHQGWTLLLLTGSLVSMIVAYDSWVIA